MLQKIRQSKFGAVMGLCLMATACGSATSTGSSGGSSTSGDSALTAGAMDSLSELPTASGPVVSGTSANVARRVRVGKAATTGVALDNLNETSFGIGDSMMMCQSAAMIKESMIAASQVDRIECYMATILEANAGTVGDIYDGNYHVIGLSSPVEGEAPGKIKVRVQKDSNGNITTFEMFTCSADNAQEEYINKTIDGTNFTMVSKGASSADGASYSHQVNVEATLNADGAFVGDKVIDTMGTQDSGDSGSGHFTMSLTQSADRFSFSGSNSYAGDRFSNVWNVYALAELLDSNVDGEAYNPGLIAIGDGAASMSFTNTYEEQTFSDTDIVSWNGDTQEDVESNDLTATAAAATLPETASAPTISFGTGEAYDCSDTPEVELVITEDVFATMGAECEAIGRGEWLNCYQETQPFEEGETTTPMSGTLVRTDDNNCFANAGGDETLTFTAGSAEFAGARTLHLEYTSNDGADASCVGVMQEDGEGASSSSCAVEGNANMAGTIFRVTISDEGNPCQMELIRQ